MTSMSLAFRLGRVERGQERLVADAQSLGSGLAVCLGSLAMQKGALLAVRRDGLVAGERDRPALLDQRGRQTILGRLGRGSLLGDRLGLCLLYTSPSPRD